MASSRKLKNSFNDQIGAFQTFGQHVAERVSAFRRIVQRVKRDITLTDCRSAMIVDEPPYRNLLYLYRALVAEKRWNLAEKYLGKLEHLGMVSQTEYSQLIQSFTSSYEHHRADATLLRMKASQRIDNEGIREGYIAMLRALNRSIDEPHARSILKRYATFHSLPDYYPPTVQLS